MGLSMSSTSVDPLDPRGTVPEASLVIDSERLNYSGLDATALTLVITNTDTRTHAADIAITLLSPGGTEVTTVVEPTVSFAPESTNSVTIDIPDTNVSTFDTVVVRTGLSN